MHIDYEFGISNLEQDTNRRYERVDFSICDVNFLPFLFNLWNQGKSSYRSQSWYTKTRKTHNEQKPGNLLSIISSFWEHVSTKWKKFWKHSLCCAFLFKVKQFSFLNPCFGHREVWTLFCFSFYFFSSHYPSTELTRSWLPWAIIAVKRQAIQATLTETKGRRLFCTFANSVQCWFMFLTFLSLTLLLLLL